MTLDQIEETAKAALERAAGLPVFYTRRVETEDRHVLQLCMDARGLIGAPKNVFNINVIVHKSKMHEARHVSQKIKGAVRTTTYALEQYRVT